MFFGREGVIIVAKNPRFTLAKTYAILVGVKVGFISNLDAGLVRAEYFNNGRGYGNVKVSVVFTGEEVNHVSFRGSFNLQSAPCYRVRRGYVFNRK